METSGNYRGLYEASGVTELQLISGRPACRFAGPPWRRRIELRAAALAGAAPLWAHVERRVGFFDEGGWVRLAQPPPGPEVPTNPVAQ